MGAMVTVVYNRDTVNENEVSMLSNALQNIVAKAINDNDVFVYQNAPEKVFGADPVEIFVQVNSQKTLDPNNLLSNIVEEIKSWKSDNASFTQSVNVNVIPVVWHSEVQI